MSRDDIDLLKIGKLEDYVRYLAIREVDINNRALLKRIDDLEQTVTTHEMTIAYLTEDSEHRLTKDNLKDGRITRLEKVVNDLHEDVVQLDCRSMKDNIIIQNIPEIPNENQPQLITLIRDVMIRQLLINPTDMNISQ